jgi:hypothetical protein
LGLFKSITEELLIVTVAEVAMIDPANCIVMTDAFVDVVSAAATEPAMFQGLVPCKAVTEPMTLAPLRSITEVLPAEKEPETASIEPAGCNENSDELFGAVVQGAAPWKATTEPDTF